MIFYTMETITAHPDKYQPNLVPPITTTVQAIEYKHQLEKLDPNVEYLMTLYLSPDLTPDEIRKASKAGVVGASLLVCFRLLDILGSKVSSLILAVSPQIRREASSRMRCITPSLKQCRRSTWFSTSMVNYHPIPHPSVSPIKHKSLD